ncbi:hypothetical protein BDR26DRAFT_944459 [Obelidium mucronatum]|nr:hypothetical protein BDR26DRAFT_944459 [Obelidium mucronatum]
MRSSGTPAKYPVVCWGDLQELQEPRSKLYKPVSALVWMAGCMGRVKTVLARIEAQIEMAREICASTCAEAEDDVFVDVQSESDAVNSTDESEHAAAANNKRTFDSASASRSFVGNPGKLVPQTAIKRVKVDSEAKNWTDALDWNSPGESDAENMEAEDLVSDEECDDGDATERARSNYDDFDDELEPAAPISKKIRRGPQKKPLLLTAAATRKKAYRESTKKSNVQLLPLVDFSLPNNKKVLAEMPMTNNFFLRNTAQNCNDATPCHDSR